MVEERRSSRTPAAPRDADAFEQALFDVWQEADADSASGPSELTDARILAAAREATASASASASASTATAPPTAIGKSARRWTPAWAAAATLFAAVGLGLIVDDVPEEMIPSSTELRYSEPPQPDAVQATEMVQRPAAEQAQAKAAPRGDADRVRSARVERLAESTAVASPPPAPARAPEAQFGSAEDSLMELEEVSAASVGASARLLEEVQVTDAPGASLAPAPSPGAPASEVLVHGRLDLRNGIWWLVSADDEFELDTHSGGVDLELLAQDASVRLRLDLPAGRVLAVERFDSGQ